MKIFWGNQQWLRAAAFYLRYQVFVLEQKIDAEAEFDNLDDEKRIYGVMMQEELPVATIRLQKDSPEQLRPDRLCVHADFRNQGLGKTLLLALEEKALKEENCSSSILSAEITAIPFYEKLGYQKISDPFLEDNIPCVTMKKSLVSL